MAKGLSMRGAIADAKQRKAAEKAISDYVDRTVAASLQPPSPFKVGEKYFVRTITMIDVGRVKAVIGNFIVLEDASWIGDTGRFHECLQKTGVFNEIEPFKHDVFINLNSIVDATPWPYDLPTAAK